MNIYSALAAARKDFPTITKDREVNAGRYTYKYADLGTILEAVTPALREHGIEIFQSINDDKLVTRIQLLEGESDYLFSTVSLPSGVDSQQLGSAVTYARRYAIVTALGLVTEDDDDGAATTERGRPAATPRTASPESAQVPAPDIPVPEGWISREESIQAHNALYRRIQALPPEAISQCKAYRQEHGWPLPLVKYHILDAQVEQHETTAADTVAAAFPGAVSQ